MESVTLPLLSPVRVVTAVLDRGVGGTCEDRVGVAGCLAWVIDGATQMQSKTRVPAASEGSWIADLIHARLMTLGDAGYDGSCQALISDLVRVIRTALAKLDWPKGGTPPVCSVGIAIARTASLDLCVVGDVSIITLGRSGLDRLTDSRFLRNELAVRWGRSERDATGLSRESDDEEGVLARRREYLYDQEAPVVLGDNESAAERARTVTVDAKAVNRMLFASDGFMRAIDVYGLLQSADMSDVMKSNRILDVARQIRQHESTSDEPARRQLRKPRDDLAAMLVELVY